MTQLQAQIVMHGEASPDGILIEDCCEVYAELAEMGVMPLTALLEMREFADRQVINEALGLPTQQPHEFKAEYRLDLNATEVFVDPEDFMKVGVGCVYHRHIVVKPVIDVAEMPSLDFVLGDGQGGH